MTALRAATRGSRLALWQTEHVIDALRRRTPSLEVEVVRIRTKGDVIRDVPLSSVGSSAFFTGEIETALLAGEADFAVHSLKDLAAVDVPGLTVAAVLPREDARDALVSGSGASLRELAPGARIGTSSVRRRAMLRAARPDLDVLDLRGNVPTRVERLDQGQYDAILVAAAGLKRLGLGGRITELLDLDSFLPPAGQGAIAVQVRDDDKAALDLVGASSHAPTRLCVDAERAFLAELGVGCQAPVGVHGALDHEVLHLRAAILSLDGSRRLDAHVEERGPGGWEAGVRLARAMRERGGEALLEESRSMEGERT